MSEIIAKSKFSCPSCGAEAQWNPAKHALVCPFCGTEAPMPEPNAGGAAVEEHDLVAALRSIPDDQRGWQAEKKSVKCQSCQAITVFDPTHVAQRCAFCGSSALIPMDEIMAPIRPESLLPFGITKQVANERFGTWLKTLWFRPNDLTKMASVQEMGGVYVPYWSFDSGVYSSWSAERGWHYMESEQVQETNADGQTEWRTREVQKTRWEPASGSRQDYYKDVLVCAGKGLPEALAVKFVSFEMARLVPYQPQFLAGWRAESYTLDLMPGWAKGQGIIAQGQEQRCSSDIGGDTSRGLQVSNQFQQSAFKHVLLPVWIAAYRYKGKVFRFLVNGQTGEIVGEAPWSVAKIALLVVFILALIGGIVAVVQSQQSHQRSNSPPAAAPARSQGRHQGH